MPFQPSEANLAALRALLEANVPMQQIFQQLDVSIYTVYRWRRRFREAGDQANQIGDLRENNARPRKLNAEEVGRVQRAIERDPFQPAYKLPERLDLNVCANTMRKVLKEQCNVKFCKAASKTQLFNRDKAARIEFANNYINLNDEDWRHTIFMDEKTFTTHKDGRIGVWRPENARFDDAYLLPKKYSGRSTAAFWGWMSGDGVGEIIEVGRHFNGQRYVEILEENFLPSVLNRYPLENIRIIEDNSPIHTARIVTDWYAEHPQLSRLRLPARSPDLNVIEHVWAKMVKDWRPGVANNRGQLIQRVIGSWQELTNQPEFCLNLTNSMHTRLNKLIEVDGSYMNY